MYYNAFVSVCKLIPTTHTHTHTYTHTNVNNYARHIPLIYTSTILVSSSQEPVLILNSENSKSLTMQDCKFPSQ